MVFGLRLIPSAAPLTHGSGYAAGCITRRWRAEAGVNMGSFFVEVLVIGEGITQIRGDCALILAECDVAD